MLVSPVLNDLLVLADVEPSAFLRSYRGAVATEGRWSSTTGADFARVGDVVVHAGPYGTGIAAEASFDGGHSLSQWNANTMLVRISRVVLPETIKMAVVGMPVPAVVGAPLLGRSGYVVRSLSTARRRDMLIFVCDAPMEPLGCRTYD